MSTNKKTILIVDDELPIRRFLRPFLAAEGYVIVEAGSGHEALSLTASHEPDVILLDLGLPDMDGEELLRALPMWVRAKVIVLSVRSRERDKVTALDLGASDYLTKPFSLAELAARIRVCLRRDAGDGESQPSRYVFGELWIDMDARTAGLAGKDLHLTPTEFKLLAYLAHHAGKVVTHSQLLKAVWGKQSPGQEHYVRIHIHKLRQKIEENPARPRYLRTEIGIGYRFAS